MNIINISIIVVMYVVILFRIIFIRFRILNKNRRLIY